MRFTCGYPLGTYQVKEWKVNLRTHKYEVIKMDNDKTTNLMNNLFNDIVLGLKGVGHRQGVEFDRKFLSTLPRQWCS